MIRFLMMYFLSSVIVYGENSTFAVIVGVSSYESEDIANLHYAHANARVFAQYLVSPAGGSVSKGNSRFRKSELLR